MRTRLGINSVITHLNYREIEGIVDFAYNLGLDFVSLVEVEKWKTPIEDDYAEERAFIQEARRKSRDIEELVRNLMRKYRGIEIHYVSSARRKRKCSWPFLATFITVDGFVTPCCIRMDPEVINFGNIFENDFKNIWYSDKYIEFRRSLINDTENPICDNCPD